MKLSNLTNPDQTKKPAPIYKVRQIKMSDTYWLMIFADFYNESGELSWKLTPPRIKEKIGSTGKLWGLFDVSDGDELVGSIAIKEIPYIHEFEGTTNPVGIKMGEIGYLMVAEQHRSFKNLNKLYTRVISKSRKFDVVYVTTNVKNKTINRLLERSNKLVKLFKTGSPYTSNSILSVYHSIVSNLTPEASNEILRSYFSKYIL